MSGADVAVSVRGLAKRYAIASGSDQATTLAEVVARTVRHPFRRSATTTFWALSDVDFDVARGEVVGIVGRNGAGKSTLLKILSRITEPTRGEIELHGRVGSLLEVGTGFHPELTGRENVYLNGAILGMRKSEIRREFDEIVAFADVGAFLDTPVKRFSSGMYVRLAFAVAAHLRSEILIVDEVLAVGDAEFQKKCLGKMKDVSTTGRTVLFVSHNLNAVANLCSRAILLEHGRVVAQGAADGVLQRYSAPVAADGDIDLSAAPRRRGAHCALRRLRMTAADGAVSRTFAPDAEVCMTFDVDPGRPVARPVFGIGFNNWQGVRVFAVNSLFRREVLPPLDEPCRVETRFRMPPLVPGQYSLDISLADSSEWVDSVDGLASVEVADVNYLETSYPYVSWMGHVLARSTWEVVSGR